MRILRKRIVLGVIFALSLTYCVLSFLREVRTFMCNDHCRKVIDIPFEQIMYVLSTIRNWICCHVCRRSIVEVMYHSCFTTARSGIQFPKPLGT
jgi:hypothetical protein